MFTNIVSVSPSSEATGGDPAHRTFQIAMRVSIGLNIDCWRSTGIVLPGEETWRASFYVGPNHTKRYAEFQHSSIIAA